MDFTSNFLIQSKERAANKISDPYIAPYKRRVLVKEVTATIPAYYFCILLKKGVCKSSGK